MPKTDRIQHIYEHPPRKRRAPKLLSAEDWLKKQDRYLNAKTEEARGKAKEEFLEVLKEVCSLLNGLK